MTQLNDLLNPGGHSAALVAAVVGPLATGGADVYKTYADSKQGRSELKQRQREFEATSKLYESQQGSVERQQALATIAAIRGEQSASQNLARYAPYLFGAVVIGGLVLVAITVAKKGGKNG